jgi:transposase
MAFNFLAAERDQLYLLPPSVADWLDEDELAWFVLDAVDQMDLEAFYEKYRSDGVGAPAHDPKMMVALLVYAYCLGVRSSRQIERACHVDVAFRVIAANQTPDHTTISRFRKNHAETLKSIFTASLRLCAQAGMAKVGLVALDGTKMGCPAALSANRAKEHIDAEVEKMLAEAEGIDAEEDRRFGEAARGDEPPADLRGRQARRERFQAAKAALDAEEAAAKATYEAHLAERTRKEAEAGKKLRGRKPKPPAAPEELKANTSDPESRIMKTKDGYLQGYNAQAVVNEDQVVVGAEVTDEQNDTAQLHPMIEVTSKSLAEAGFDARPEKLLADAGYCSEENLASFGEDEPDPYIATRNTKKSPTPRAGRRGPLRRDATLVEKMDRKVSTTTGAALYKKRQHMVEPVFGQTKEGRGARRFMRRGLQAAQSEWKLLMGTHNFLKLYRRAVIDRSITPWWTATRTALA